MDKDDKTAARTGVTHTDTANAKGGGQMTEKAGQPADAVDTDAGKGKATQATASRETDRDADKSRHSGWKESK